MQSWSLIVETTQHSSHNTIFVLSLSQNQLNRDYWGNPFFRLEITIKLHMATPSPPPPHVKPNLRPSPPPAQPSPPSSTVEQEHQQLLPITPNPPIQTPPRPQQQRQQQKQPDFINYVADLRNLSPALSAFHRRYDELHEHLEFIRTSIDSQLLQLLDTDEITPAVEILPTAHQSGNSIIQTFFFPLMVA